MKLGELQGAQNKITRLEKELSEALSEKQSLGPRKSSGKDRVSSERPTRDALNRAGTWAVKRPQRESYTPGTESKTGTMP